MCCVYLFCIWYNEIIFLTPYYIIMFVLPEFKKPYSAFEPYIDAQTMEIHHQKHHGAYVTNLNQALVDGGYHIERIEDIFENITDMSSVIRNNAGGHYNHTIFWSLLHTNMATPSATLALLINQKYGLFDDFKAEFTKAALSVFGSGWVWLVIDNQDQLDIVTTSRQDNPLMSDINRGYPLLGLDVWEHAYYLKYQNRRIEYINAFWSVLDWDMVSERLATRPEMNDLA